MCRFSIPYDHLAQQLANTQRELEREREERLCGVCQARVPNQRLSCGHVLCRSCSDEHRVAINTCPFCRALITSVGHIYLP